MPPSGKVGSNDLILSLAVPAFNILRDLPGKPVRLRQPGSSPLLSGVDCSPVVTDSGPPLERFSG